LLFILGEWLFPRLLGKLPLRLYGSIETNLRILAQSSKKDLLPNEYIKAVEIFLGHDHKQIILFIKSKIKKARVNRAFIMTIH